MTITFVRGFLSSLKETPREDEIKKKTPCEGKVKTRTLGDGFLTPDTFATVALFPRTFRFMLSGNKGQQPA